MRVGDIALAVGNPLGIGQTVTMGIVSAKGRATGSDDSYQDFIQTDAPINQGNSGGALVNTQGELIGINSQILSPSGGNIGIGFAIPANMARNVMTQLIEHGNVRRGLLGVTVQPLTSDIARSLNVGSTQGALVNNVTPGGAADKAGLKRGDIITAVNGRAGEGQQQPPQRGVGDDAGQRSQGQHPPGRRVSRRVGVRLGERQASAEESTDRREPGASSGFGLSVEPLTRETARQLGVSSTSGLVVTGVEPSSRAADAGLQEGDVIEEVNGAKVTTGEGLKSALNASTGKPALLLVHRGDVTVYVPLAR